LAAPSIASCSGGGADGAGRAGWPSLLYIALHNQACPTTRAIKVFEKKKQKKQTNKQRKTRFMVPVWRHNSRVDYVMLEGVENDDAKNIWVGERTPISLFTAPATRSRLSRVRNFACDELKAQLKAVLCAIELSELRTLFCNRRLRPSSINALLEVLARVPHLQQLRIAVDSDSKSLADVWGKISTLPLQALCISANDYNPDPKELESFLSVFKSLGESLVGCELISFISRPLLSPICRHGLRFLHQLQLLDLSSNALSDNDMEELCRALESMPHLVDLSVFISTRAALQMLTQFVGACFRPLKNLMIDADDSIQNADALCDALSRNTRLQRLILPKPIASSVLITSGLLDRGWLIEYFPTGWLTEAHIPRDVLKLIQRNKDRHKACGKFCAQLIALRKKRHILSDFPFDIVLILAKSVWETRNEKEWDKN
jgi:hypothetical protein